MLGIEKSFPVLPPAVEVYANNNELLIVAVNDCGTLTGPSNLYVRTPVTTSAIKLGEVALNLLMQSNQDADQRDFQAELAAFLLAARVQDLDGLGEVWKKRIVVWPKDADTVNIQGYYPCKTGGYATDMMQIAVDKTPQTVGSAIVECLLALSGQYYEELHN